MKETTIQIINEINNIFLSVQDDNIYNQVLGRVKDFFKSSFGVFGYIAENGDIVFPGLTDETGDRCEVADRSIVFPAKTRGDSLWGRAIREKRSFHSTGPFKTPEGHLRIKNFLTSPIIYRDAVIGLISLANREPGYTDTEREQLESICRFISPILNVRLQRDRISREQAETEKTLSLTQLQLNTLVNNIPYLIARFDSGVRYLFVNDAVTGEFGSPREEFLGKSVREFPRGGPSRMGEIFYQQIKQVFETGETVRYEAAWEGEKGERQYNVRHIPEIDNRGNVASVLSIAHSITESKILEEKLRLREQEYRTLVENFPDFIVRYNREMRRTYVNPAWERESGLTANEVVNVPVERIPKVPNPTVEEYVRRLNKVLETGSTEKMDFPWINARGETLFLEYTLIPEYDPQGRISGALSIGHDITERKKIEKERLANLRFFEGMDAINRAIHGTGDPDEMMREVLEEVVRIFECDRAFLLHPCDPHGEFWGIPMVVTAPGLSKDDFRGDNIPLDPDVSLVMRTVLESKAPVRFDTESKIQLPENFSQRFGIKSSLAMTIHPVNHKPWQLGLHHCSTERTLTREEERLFREIGNRLSDGLANLLMYRNLQESENRYRRITEGLTDFQYTAKIKEGDITETIHSPVCETVTGYTAEEYAADPSLLFRIIFPDDLEMVRENYRQLLAGNGVPPLEHRIIRKDGKVRWVSHVRLPYRDPTGRLLAYDGVIKDITLRKQAEEEVRLLNRELEERVTKRTIQYEEANRELESFAYSVSHDLRAPLRHISGFLDLFMKNADMEKEFDQKNRNYLTNISQAAVKMGKLIDDLLSFSRMGRQEIIFQEADLEKITESVIREVEPDTAERNIRWQITGLPVVRGDISLLRIVMVNLISNALKFTRPREQAVIEVGCESRGDETVVFVRDNGVGFDKEYTDKIFGVFQRLHREDEFEGSGVGLSMVQRIVHRHGGKIWADGEVDRGAVFYFSLPDST